MATPEHLTETLAESALDFGARALKDYLSGDSRVLLMHAGICVEHAAKACLANLSPVLLADIHNGSFDSLLMLSGLGSQARVGRLRTIGCREATSRVARLRPAQVGGDTLELLIGIRDGIVHVGYAEESDARDLLAASLRYASELLKDLVGRDPLWGSHAELVESLISESLTRTQQVVTRKIATAKLFVADLASRVPPEELAMVLSVRQSSSATAVYGDNDEFEVSCPVCEDDNARSIGPSTIQWLPDFDIGDEGEEYIAGLYGVKEMYPNRFECGACGLTLDSADEIRAAGLETTIELEDGLNPADFPEEFEPDPDLREDK